MQNPIYNQALKARSGSALIIVLWVIGLLSLFVMTFAFDMHIEARITSSWRKKLKAEYLSRGGVEMARMALLETSDPDINNTNNLIYLSKGSDEDVRYAAIALAQGSGAQFERELGAGKITVDIQPENIRANVNKLIFINDRQLTYNTWDPFFETIGVPDEMRDLLVDCLLDWVDQNELTHLNGAESMYYESLEPPYKSKNAALDTVNELMLIKGFDETIPDTDQTIYEALSGFLTTYTEEPKINVNAATVAQLMAFLGIDAIMAEEIITERAGPDGEVGTNDDRPFKDMNDLLARVQGLDQAMSSHITFSAMGRFNIRSMGRVGDIEHQITCILQLTDNTITILNWSEENQN